MLTRKHPKIRQRIPNLNDLRFDAYRELRENSLGCLHEAIQDVDVPKCDTTLIAVLV